MSRKEIESLLSDIFSEKGLVKLILEFDDFPLDLIRRFINVIQNSSFYEKFCQTIQICGSCGDARRNNDDYEYGDPVGFNNELTWCQNLHLEISLDKGLFMFSPRGVKLRLQSITNVTNEDISAEQLQILEPRLFEIFHQFFPGLKFS